MEIASQCIQMNILREYDDAPLPPHQFNRVVHLPYRVQHIPILKYPEQFVIRSDFVKVGPLLIGKEQVWFPYGV